MADLDRLARSLTEAWHHIRILEGHVGLLMTRLPDPALTPSADLPACRDEDPATPATLAAAYPDPPEYQHPEDGHGNA